MSEIEKKPNNKGHIFKIIIIVFLAAILLGGGVFGGYMISNKLGKPQAASADNAEKAELNQKTFALDEFLVNLNAENSTRYLKTKIYIGYSENKEAKDFETELTDKKPIIRDAINTVLRTKKAEDFTEAGVEKLKEEIKNRINPLLGKGQIVNVYFSEILVQ
ncbi:flagellar basal body-associated FliL family protein [Clostridium sp. ZS2-4]|uniref:flagellar basal body-associated FliL family protein n=1 Tax=Clostridium sp. ZS2-4 TaxID=2987703 RepID=UPI00227BCC38|nr:flagellar basal body-associated FliL family protein [Clostridium sp. ZS2-4]MCY6354012.1 flagellar basal body-associated FliL family protein [Clostridium sp. ZS2-4]